MRLRAIGADRLALALADAQMINDPGPEQEHEQRAGRDRAAGAEGDVAKDVEQRAEYAKRWKRVGKLDQPVKHSTCPMPPRAARRCPCCRLTAGKHALRERLRGHLHPCSS